MRGALECSDTMHACAWSDLGEVQQMPWQAVAVVPGSAE